MEQSYLLAAGERGRGEGLGLCTLAAEILECQAIVVRLKIKIPNKKTSKGLRRRREEIFQSLKILVFIFNYYEPLPPQKKDSNKRGKSIHQKNRQPVPRGKEKNSPELGTRFAFVFEM